MTHAQAALLIKYQLTPRQLAVANLAHQGLTNKEIADKLFIGEKGVKYHMSLVFKGCGVTSRIELKNLIDKICKFKID